MVEKIINRFGEETTSSIKQVMDGSGLAQAIGLPTSTSPASSSTATSSLGKLIEVNFLDKSLHLDDDKIYQFKEVSKLNGLKQFSDQYSIEQLKIDSDKDTGSSCDLLIKYQQQQQHHHQHFHNHLNSEHLKQPQQLNSSDKPNQEKNPQPSPHLHHQPISNPSCVTITVDLKEESKLPIINGTTNEDHDSSLKSTSPQSEPASICVEKLEKTCINTNENGNERFKLNQDVALQAVTLPRTQGQTHKDTSTLRRNGENAKKRSRSFIARLLSNFPFLSISGSRLNGKDDDEDSSTDSYKSLRRSRERSSNHQSTNVLSNSMSSQDAVNLFTCNCLDGTHGKTTNQTKSKPLTLSGIKNHGNTCFMNAILQCLSHTDLLIEYFNDTQFYYKDLITRQQLNMCKNGSSSEVTAQCASLFQSLWKNNYSPDLSSKFKSLIGKQCKQYEDGGQHDAQEFLFFLLDIFHEDLNVAIRKKAKKFKIPSTWNRPDEIIAAETLSIYTRCDNSFIRKVFQAQLRSSVVCRSCKSHSNTFDPYMCLSLPVPTKLTHICIINVSYLDKVPKKIKMAVTIETQATLKEMRHKISRLIKIPENQLVLLINDSSTGIKELNQYKTQISEFLNDNDEIEAIETPELDTNQNCNTGSPKSTSTTSQQLTLVWTNRVGIGSSGDNKFFGPYFSCKINRDASFKDLQSELVKTMQPILRLTSVSSCIKDLPLFKLKVVGGIQDRCYLPEHGDHPLYSSTVNEALAHCKDKDYRGPTYVMLIVEWDSDLKQTLVVDDDEALIVSEDPNMEYVIARNRLSNQATLEDCFDMYFREEKLDADDAWMCPSCKKKQQCIKKLSLWSTPDILIIHLKRFRQSTNLQRNKLSTLVNFPFTGLDMNPYLSKRKANVDDYKESNGDVNNLSYILYPWKKPREKEVLPYYSEDNIYDLYAVCNHHGNMSSGHYTAYCRDINDHKWYSFDDQQVTKVSENSLVTGDAYILFYQRSTIPPFTLPSSESPSIRTKRVSSSSSSSSSSTSSSSSSSSSSLSSTSNADQSSNNSLTSQSNVSLNNDNQSSPVN